VKQIGGKVEDKDALRKALSRRNSTPRAASSVSTRTTSRSRITTCARSTGMRSGRITNKTVGKVFSDFQDVHAAKCKMN
jgi:hypothetical protein